MLISYTQMDRVGTRGMHILGLPLYGVTWFVCVATSSRGAIWFFGLPIVVGLAYTFLYSKLRVRFSVHPTPSIWRFLFSVLCLQFAIGLLLVAVG